jgi:hypothetical protein
MPPGNTRAKAPAKVIEKRSVEACLAIARRVQRSRERSGDAPGATAAGQVAALIQAELLGEAGA